MERAVAACRWCSLPWLRSGCSAHLARHEHRASDCLLAIGLRFVSILKSHHSSNRSHQGHGKRRKASGRSCLSAFATAFTTAGRTSAGICATAASSRYAEASARCLSARSRRSVVRRTTLGGSATALPSCAPINRDHAREHECKSKFCFEVGDETRNPPRPINY